ncbi:MAG: hypothetical protein COV79_04390 [Parcubacteria group bacterium CG11_big_fil_rev_8_21_14_0_20_41_14]|nr:MAG: hypothetical protein COV79_04390 [Parcubacteria group bacterium CG11_big_fil_rev_8_21_14_0_20_41_14]PIR57508.1 MAG: hypothetical protein COU72_00565 [Parcubacteria group bacterium CG10_big_fil_rev_8_21_14_0_10_41_35]
MNLSDLPLNMVFLRHGKSEWNFAHEQDEAGDPSFMRKLSKRASDNPALVPEGEREAKSAWGWLGQRFSFFDELWTSPLARAESSALASIYPQSMWKYKADLQERCWGDATFICKEDMNIPENAELFEWKQTDPFSWKPNKGESLTEALVRADRIINDLRRVGVDKSVICVSHGELISLLRMCLESWDKERYIQQSNAHRTKEWVSNGHILWYTRVEPWSSYIADIPKWLYSVCPWDPSRSHDCWQEI